MFLQSIPEEEATGRVAEIYEINRAKFGFVMAATKSFTARPDLLPIYVDFYQKVVSGFSLGQRAWRLITLIAAKHVPSTYCSYVYAKQLIGDLGSKEAVIAVQKDFRTAGLSDGDVEMLAYAEKISKDASQISQRDIDRLRAIGFTDQEICDIAFCAAFRCFVSRFFDALGATPEADFIDSDAEFRAAMTVGKTY